MTNTLKCDMCGADAGDSPYHATIDKNGHVHICDGCFYSEHYDLGVLWRERERILAKLNSSKRRLDEVTASRANIERQRDELLAALKQMVSIVDIHSRATKNNFAWAEMDEARAAIEVQLAAIAKAGDES